MAFDSTVFFLPIFSYDLHSDHIFTHLLPIILVGFRFFLPLLFTFVHIFGFQFCSYTDDPLLSNFDWIPHTSRDSEKGLMCDWFFLQFHSSCYLWRSAFLHPTALSSRYDQTSWRSDFECSPPPSSIGRGTAGLFLSFTRTTMSTTMMTMMINSKTPIGVISCKYSNIM